jgi:nitroimidazol reductase NimA-like FMN-containing flavoprotein (pyridoxamine 5'-phosphate oxidase superfamily)
VRRLPARASYDPADAHAILDEGFVAHVGLATDDGPVVIPMLYARDGDGLVLARSAFHHSVNYRSVVVIGRATPVTDDAKRALLDRLVEHIVPGRTADARPPSEKELRATLVLELPLAEASVKVRTGDPLDDEEDLDLPVWAGVIPLALTPGDPRPAGDLAGGIAAPRYAREWSRSLKV